MRVALYEGWRQYATLLNKNKCLNRLEIPRPEYETFHNYRMGLPNIYEIQIKYHVRSQQGYCLVPGNKFMDSSWEVALNPKHLNDLNPTPPKP